MQRSYAADAYRRNQILTAPQNKLIIMLYDGILKNLRLAKIALEEKNNTDTNKHLIKAQDIIMELMTTLNFEEGKAVAEGLYKMYDYMYFKLIEANTNKSVEAIDEVEKYTKELRETWTQI